jgi:UDPglucose--hexose-1-phosphate uridylyltransferase
MTARTSIRLADGRELIYFDDRPGHDRHVADARDLAQVETSPQIRHDPVHDEWVIIAAHRQTRTHLPPASECPLCPSRAGHLTEIPDSDYDVVVFENRFPSLVPEPAGVDTVEGLYERRPGIGRCEVLSYTSDHDAAFADLSAERLRTVSRAWVDRTAALSKLPGVEYVFCFENRGEEIGVTLNHPHGQIYAYPFIPPRIERALTAAEAHRARTGGCVFCDVVAAEVASGERIIATTDRFVAFVPAAARWPFEAHIYARDHVPDLAALDEDTRAELHGLQADVLRRFNGLFPKPPPYIMGWAQAPVSRGRELWHLHLEILSARRSSTKLKYLAGSESGAGVFINDVLPERAAELLRTRSAAP